jgi:Fe-S-cluster containining protein
MPQPTRRRPETREARAAKGGATTATNKRKKALPIVQAERAQVPCLACGLCCTYIAMEINGPTTVKRASEILWHLYHERVSVYRDSDDEWFVQFETRCQNLQDDNKCAIYADRPHVCREYSEQSCEVNAEDEGTSFYNATEFLQFMAKHRKRIHAQLVDGYAPNTPAGLAHLQATKRPSAFKKRFQAVRKA